MTNPRHPHAGSAQNLLRVLCFLCLLALPLSGCVKSGSKSVEAHDPNEKQLGYSLKMSIPPSWTATALVSPQAGSKQMLDGQRKSGRPVPLLEATSGSGGIIVTLVNEDGAFMPRQYAEKLSPEEFQHMSREILERERTLAKKKRVKNALLDIQISRDMVGGNLALLQSLMVLGPDGQPTRLLHWDVYLPDGAGLAVRTSCTPGIPGSESEVSGIVKSLRSR